MTYLGTRPILQDELRQYELHHRARIAIKPGITGMWQVSGRSDITDFYFDTQGSPTKSLLGEYGQLYERDENGRINQITYLDSDRNAETKLIK